MNHGADHIFVFSEEDMNECFEKGFAINKEDLPTTKEDNTYIGLFPIGGSNCSDSHVTLLESKEEVIKYLQQEALGPDAEDPCLVDLAEYYFQIEKSSGMYYATDTAVNILKEAGLDKKKLEEKAMEHINEEIKFICETLNIDRKQFYDDEYRDMRLSEVYEISDKDKEKDI